MSLIVIHLLFSFIIFLFILLFILLLLALFTKLKIIIINLPQMQIDV